MYIVDATSVSHTRETSTILSNDFNNTYACVHVLDDAHVDLCIFPKKKILRFTLMMNFHLFGLN